MQHQLLQMLEQRAPRAVHHALGKSGGARRIHHVQRVVKRQTRELQRRGGDTFIQCVPPPDRAIELWCRCPDLPRSVRNDHDPLDTRQ